MKIAYSAIALSLLLQLCIRTVDCLILESFVGGTVVTLLGVAYNTQCKFWECCNVEYVVNDMGELQNQLTVRLYGQQIAQKTVLSAVQSHVNHQNPKKPLVLSFHGPPGSGKNFVASMVAKSLFLSGEKSNFYHFFNGRTDFTLDTDTKLHQSQLKAEVEKALKSCGRSLFVFDEVDKMPSGVLDILIPFLDYTTHRNHDKNKAIFIFLSNTGSGQIMDRVMKQWEEGKSRNSMTIQDFETLISIGAFNEKGALYRSDTIQSSLIDHYVPFLPLEQSHVISCLKDSFAHWGEMSPTQDLIEEALHHVTWGPQPRNLFSTAGCKRLDQKVANILHQKKWNF